MATHYRTIERGDGPARSTMTTATEPQVGDLLRQLGTEGGALLRHELALAKLEMRDMAREVALDSAKLFGALTLVMAGVLALLAAATVGIGNVLDGRYALAALIVGVITLAIGALLARTGVAGLKHVRGPEQTADSLRTTKQWMSGEMHDFKEEIRS